MKRLFIAIAFLALAFGLCTFEQITINKTYSQANSYIDRAIEQVEKQDFKGAEETCSTLDEYWDSKQQYLTAMIDHGSLDDTGVTITSLKDMAKNESDDLEGELITAKNQIKSIYDNQKITFGNIF